MKQNVLITGGSSGIGFAIAEEFASEDYNLILVASNQEKLYQSADKLRKSYPNITISLIAKDLTRPESVNQIYEELMAQDLNVDVLVNDAGIGARGTFESIPIDKQVSIIRLNIEALVRLTYAFLPGMLRRAHGKILNLGSIAGFEPGPLFAVYHASKAFVVSFTEALAEELKDTNIQVCCLCPGATDTDFFARAGMEDTNIVQSGMLMEPERVAKEGVHALKNGDRVHVPGGMNKAMTFVRRILPVSTQAKMNKKFYESSDKAKPQ